MKISDIAACILLLSSSISIAEAKIDPDGFCMEPCAECQQNCECDDSESGQLPCTCSGETPDDFCSFILVIIPFCDFLCDCESESSIVECTFAPDFDFKRSIEDRFDGQGPNLMDRFMRATRNGKEMNTGLSSMDRLIRSIGNGKEENNGVQPMDRIMRSLQKGKENKIGKNALDRFRRLIGNGKEEKYGINLINRFMRAVRKGKNDKFVASVKDGLE